MPIIAEKHLQYINIVPVLLVKMILPAGPHRGAFPCALHVVAVHHMPLLPRHLRMPARHFCGLSYST